MTKKDVAYICPNCGEKDGNKITNSRDQEDGAVRKRKRKCKACGISFKTQERVASKHLVQSLNPVFAQDFLDRWNASSKKERQHMIPTFNLFIDTVMSQEECETI